MRAILVWAMFLALPNGALAAGYVSDGHIYDLRCNKDGYVLTSRYPIVRIIGVGAGSQQVAGRETVFLGRSCDAGHKLFGQGSWCWANGGFVVRFAGHSFGFPRQELTCQPDPESNLNCRC